MSYGVFRRRSSPPRQSTSNWVPSAPNASQTVIPSTAALVLATFAPVIALTVTPATASLTLTSFAPSIVVNTIITPSTSSLTLSPFAPTVTATANQTVTPAVASLALTTFAPTVTASGSQVVTPTAASLTLSTLAPTVTATAHVTCTPSTAIVALSTFAPVMNLAVAPTPASLVLSTFAPTVTTTLNIEVTPNLAALVLTRYAPTVEATGVEPTIILVGGDDAPPKRKGPRRDREQLFREIESTVHTLLHPKPESERAGGVSPPEQTEDLGRRVDELVVLAQGQHRLLQRAAAIRAELNRIEADRQVMLEQDEEDALLLMF